MSGHSRWANIKHKKGKSDVKKGKVFTKFIKEVKDLKKVMSFAKEKKSNLGTGGMASKIHAAEICKQKHVEMWIVNGGRNNFLIDAFQDKISFTKFRL